MKATCISLILLLTLLLNACAAAPAAAPTEPPPPPTVKFKAVDYNPTYTPATECPFGENMLPNVERECGYLTVPEDRTVSDGPEIKIAVAIYKSNGKTPKSDPLLILVSNPSGEISFSPAFPYTLQDLIAERDFIVMDMRGSGFSQPSFQCPQASELYYQTLDQNTLNQAWQDRYTDAVLACRQQ